ncbi:MAG: hypothetical protein AB7F86_10190 [Bdellovibrionales bacterium]
MFRFLIFSAALTAIQVGARTVSDPLFHSQAGQENLVEFNHVVKTDFSTLQQIRDLTPESRQLYIRNTLQPLAKFIFGPATRRSIGGPQRDEYILAHWTRAYVEESAVYLPITYKAVWILDKSWVTGRQLRLPLPLRISDLFTPQWKKCTDSAPNHATPSFYWYFWDPARPGCDHVEGHHYKIVDFTIGTRTPNEEKSFPEYNRLFNADGSMSLTFAFGYVEDPADPYPDRDYDYGASQYRSFLAQMQRALPSWRNEEISSDEYPESFVRARTIGHRLTGEIGGVKIRINVVMSAGVDQIYLFAKSFAHDHDGFFSWMGHSRVGSGFDADKFQSLLVMKPDYYSISNRYQLVYWGGCNSYSYYTLPFFQLKAAASNGADPTGTKGLDIIAHGLPSYFALNARNAMVLAKALLNPPPRTSYQSIIHDIEQGALSMGRHVLAVVLGDEDNDLDF